MDVAFEKRQNVFLDLLVNGLDDAFAVHGLPKVALLKHGLQRAQHHVDLVGWAVLLAQERLRPVQDNASVVVFTVIVAVEVSDFQRFHAFRRESCHDETAEQI